jgi:hypothetical protein
VVRVLGGKTILRGELFCLKRMDGGEIKRTTWRFYVYFKAGQKLQCPQIHEDLNIFIDIGEAIIS